MKRLLVLLSMAFMILVSGCSSDNVMDKYSFGNQVIRVAQSEITLPSPFELGLNSTLTSDKDGYPLKSYAGTTPTFFVNAEGITAQPNKPLPTAAAFAEKAVNSLKTTNGINVKDVETTPITLDNVPVYKQKIKYTAKNGVTFSFLQYVFVDKGVLWNIVYQYPTSDTEGQQIVKYVEDKIQITH